MKCWGKAHELSEEELIAHLLSLSIQLGRTPSRLESNHRSSCIRRFGSWNNALLAAGIKPNRSLNQRMYRRRQCIAKDGHKCDSVSELIIDNWLAMYSIPHSKGYPYPTTGHIADWSLNNLTYVEYFGLARDSKRYDQEIDRKRNLCKESGIKLIEIYSKDLFPKNNLRAIFGEYLDS